MQDTDWSGIADVGLYTVPMAARILATQQDKVRSWVEGYSNSDSPPILVRQVPRIGGRTVLGFLDLVESAFVRHFREVGYSAQTIRRVAWKLRERHGNDHPFAMHMRFRADGKHIFEEVVRDDGERSLVNVMSDNFVMLPTVEKTLFDQVFYVNDLATEFAPLPEYPDVILNPKLSFGRPTLRGCRIPTETIARSYIAEGSLEDTADEFGISFENVQAAVNFEAELERRTIH